jgi:hypothetical protein
MRKRYTDVEMQNMAERILYKEVEEQLGGETYSIM